MNRRSSREDLLRDVWKWAERIGVADKIQSVQIRRMKRKWASVSSRGRLTLNTDLLDQPIEFRNEVIVHELVHLKLGHGRHNKMFKAFVSAYLHRYRKHFI